jgi:competence protein ComEC
MAAAVPAASADTDPNLRATVMTATYRGLDVFLPADAESEVTGALPLPDVDVLKVAHHGSEDPGLADLLTRLRPEVAVIEVGRGNRFGHPHPATLAALRTAGVTVHRTDEDGDVVMTGGDRGL